MHEFGARLLENMPQNALVLAKGDLPSNTLRYHTQSSYSCNKKHVSCIFYVHVVKFLHVDSYNIFLRAIFILNI